MIDKRFTFNHKEDLQETETPTEQTTAVKSKKTISWVELLIIACCGVFFLFALTSRILFEYRTDDYSNTEVTVGSCTFLNNTLIRYDGSESIVNIPKYYEIGGEKYGITAIDREVFYYNSTIEEIIMPDQIKTVGLFAFRECHNLRSIRLSNSIETLGDSCFWNCVSLTEINLPTSLKRIDPYAFWNTAITTIDIPENVEEIGLGAFNNCSQLETVYIRHNEMVRTSFTDYYQAFSRCPNLQAIYVPEDLIEIYENDANWSLYRGLFQAIGGTNA
ncbi:MAG: leucine-rich repeat domain-containing protein [Anaeroplasma bactoclasticum]|nr:leucine-rich repeat domain-containing protein [Anaeroplasma bactoclasticum]